MNRMVIKTKVGTDGVLHLDIPMGAAEAGRDVQIFVEPNGAPQKTEQAYAEFLDATAGAWQGDFERPDQGQFEERILFVAEYLLDSNAWIAHLRQTQPSVTARLRREPPVNVLLCAVVVAELHFGALRSGQKHRANNLALLAKLRQQYFSLPFDDGAAEISAEIRDHLAALGTPIGPNDLMIAAIARANGFIVVTHNTAEFSRVPGLSIEDWQIP